MTRTLAAAVCLGLALSALPTSVSAQTNISKRVTIDVSEAAPRHVVELLARAVVCRISDDSYLLSPIKKLLGIEQQCFFWLHPAVTQPQTMLLVNVPVSIVLPTISQSIGCEYRFDGTNVWIKPGSKGTKTGRREGGADLRPVGVDSPNREAGRAEFWRTLRTPLPRNLRFTNATFSNVLDALAAVSGMDLEPWKDEGRRLVSIDVSGKPLVDALQAIVTHIDGYGYVRVRDWDGEMTWLGFKGNRKE